ncbi:MAG: permease-like cell division protein FtsX [Marmoricola sp.]
MALKYVFSETRNGLKRNVSMTIALVVTIFISLTLAGLGLLLNAQAHKTEEFWGSRLQITVFLCNDADKGKRGTHCDSGEVNDAQKQAITAAMIPPTGRTEVKKFELVTKEQAYEAFKRVYVSNQDDTAFSILTPDDMEEQYRVTLKDPNKYLEVEDQLRGMDGVAAVRDLRKVLKPIYSGITWMKWSAISVSVFLLIAAILQVANTIRLAAFARRKEIGIMRLVGASTLYISLPFLMETLTAALIALGLTGLTIGGVMKFGIRDRLRHNFQVTEWVNWHDSLIAFAEITVVGIVITLIPTLVMTRKYLKV